MLDWLPRPSRRTLAADKGYDTADFVAALRDRLVTPHVAANDGAKVARLTAPPLLVST